WRGHDPRRAGALQGGERLRLDRPAARIAAQPGRALRQGAGRVRQTPPDRAAEVCRVADQERGHPDPERHRRPARRPATGPVAVPRPPPPPPRHKATTPRVPPTPAAPRAQTPPPP